MHQSNYDVINYIDDILGIDLPSKIDASFDALCHLLPELGFQISKKKLEPPTTALNCLGIMIDTKTFTMSIPPAKLKEIMDMCSQWTNKKYCSKRQLQSMNINLKVTHIPGKVNIIADLLSRWGSRPMANATLCHLLPVHTWTTVNESHIAIDWSI